MASAPRTKFLCADRFLDQRDTPRLSFVHVLVMHFSPKLLINTNTTGPPSGECLVKKRLVDRAEPGIGGTFKASVSVSSCR